MENIRPVFISMTQSRMFQLLSILIVMDILFGCLRAMKEKSFNSSIGINGMIRKAGMMLSCICMAWVDNVIDLNLIGFIPEAIRSYLPIDNVDIMTFFAIIFAVYEVLSVLKNMTLSGLPVDKIWKTVGKFLKENTGEIIDIDEEEKKEEVTADDQEL